MLLVEVPSPVADRKLYITTDWDDEITVAFDMYHQHFLRLERSTEEVVALAGDFIDRLVQEEAVVGVKMENGEWKGSRLFVTEDLSKTEANEYTYFVSWLGTYDQ
jgi:hypothetical protein